MKADRPADLWLARGLGAAACVGLAALGGGLARAEGAVVGAIAGAGAALAIDRAAGRRHRARRAALAHPFPEAWRQYLLEAYDHFERLPPGQRALFEDDVRIFLAETRITGVEVDVDDELRLLVAASAVTLSLGWRDFEWSVLAEVLLYPENFDRDYGFENAELAGQAHPWGTIIISVPSLYESFENPDDAFHVGLHEFAHLLDVDGNFEGPRVDGVPGGLDESRQRQWLSLAEKEMERLRHGKSVIDDYGANELTEFFAVAVEAFFESSLALRRDHTELYQFLAGYFGQDPAAWDDARGLRL